MRGGFSDTAAARNHECILIFGLEICTLLVLLNYELEVFFQFVEISVMLGVLVQDI